MSDPAFVQGRFTAPRARRERLTAALAAHVAADARVRMLDLGCGSGLQLLDLAAAFPEAELVGVDTSRVNVESARRAIAAHGDAHRITVHEGDYLEFTAEPFDVIVSDSVLQNIPADDDRLYGKLAGDIRYGGLLVASMPYACAFNRALWCARRALGLARGPLVERVALAVAGRLHPEWDRELLRERLPYMYMLPARVDGVRMAAALAARGLERIVVAPVPHASLAQPKHRLSVYRKESGKEPDEGPGG